MLTEGMDNAELGYEHIIMQNIPPVFFVMVNTYLFSSSQVPYYQSIQSVPDTIKPSTVTRNTFSDSTPSHSQRAFMAIKAVFATDGEKVRL